MLVESAASKVKSLLHSQPPQIVKPRPHRPNLPRKLGYAFPADELENFFVRELHYTRKWTKNCIVPFTHDLLRKSYSDLLFCRNLDIVTIGFKELSMLKEAARRLPQRRQRALWKWARKMFFSTRRSGEIFQAESCSGANAVVNVNVIQLSRNDDSPAALQGLRRLFAELQNDNVSGVAALWRQLSRVEVFRTIFQIIELRHFEDGSVIVNKQETDQEIFPVLRDVRFLFEPVAGEEVLQDLRKLFHEKKTRPGLKQRLTNLWNSFKSKLTLKSTRRQDDCVGEKEGFVDGRKRFKAAVRI